MQPVGTSINTGVDKDLCLGTEFALIFPTVDTSMYELTRLGPGAHIYKLEIDTLFIYLFGVLSRFRSYHDR